MSNQVIVKIQGGLGNQLFQYAFGRAMSIRTKANLLLDLSEYEQAGNPEHTKREYYLDKLSIKAEPISLTDLNRLLSARKIWRFVVRKPIVTIEALSDVQVTFDPSFLTQSATTYYKGYWQSEKYFAEVGQTIRSELMLPRGTGDYLSLFEDQITSTNSISLHVRRGDYITNPKAKKLMGTLGLDYYQHALDFVTSKVGKANVYCFSDDIKWAKSNIVLEPRPVFVDGRDHTPLDEMRFMSLCNHNIIANSSFSWWGAWLNSNPNKIVVAPYRWYKDPTKNSSDIIPASWYVI